MKQILVILLFLSLTVSGFCKKPLVVAHRGHHIAEGSAQNSIRSLVKADSIHADMCEFDVWISADDILYVNHNADINGRVIETSTSADIDKCKLPNGEYIPRLETFLDTAATLKIDLVLEVKPHKDIEREDVAVAKIIEMVNNKGLAERTTYITFSENACRKLVAESGRPVYYLTGVPPEKIAELGATGPDFHISHFRKNPDWLETFRREGKPINIWTVDKDEDIVYCIENGADFITTNRPEQAQRLIEAQK